MAKKSSNQVGGGCLILFGLPFFLAGLFVIGLGVKAVYTAAVISAWEEVDGRVENVTRGEDNASVDARLSYSWEGRSYSTTKLNPYSMKEEGWESRMYTKLKKIHDEESSVPVLVNPDDPAEAVLQFDSGYLQFIFPFLFGGIFALVGGGVIAAGVFGTRHSRKLTKLQEAAPGEPWKWREDWVNGRVQSEQKFALIGIGVFALFWNAISWTVTLGLLTSGDQNEWFVYLFVGLFPLIGLVLIGVFVKAVLTARITGKSAFVFSPESGPFRRGSEVMGFIETDRAIPARMARDLEIGLRLVNKDKIRSGKNTRIIDDVVWSKFVSAPTPVSTPGGTRIDFKLPVPRQLSDTQDPQPGGHHEGETETHWEVLLRGKGEAKAVDLSYAIPVFGEAEAGGNPDEEALIETSELDDEYDRIDPLTAAEMEDVGVDRYASKDGSITYVRNGKGRFGIGGTFFMVGALFLPSAWFLIRPESPVFAVISGMIGLSLALVGIGTITHRGALRIDPAKRQLVKMTKCFGIKRMKVIGFDEVSGISAITNGSVNNKPMMVLEVKSESAKGFRIIGLMLDSVVARKLARQVSDELDAAR